MINASPVVEPDVLIIGGGITGHWLLKRLIEKNYSAILLERPGADCQTRHSHAYIHGGHFWGSNILVPRIREAQAEWKKFLAQFPDVIVSADAHYVFAEQSLRAAFEADVLKKQRDWAKLGDIEGQHDAFPQAQSIGRVDETFTLDAEKLIEALCQCQGCESRTRAVDGIEGISCQPGASGVLRIDVAINGAGIKRTVRPKAVVFAAGRSNGDLISSIDGDGIDRNPSKWQQLRLTHMLVLEGRTRDGRAVSLPEFNGQLNVARNSAIFVASRDSEGRTIWLVTNGRMPNRLYAEPGSVCAADDTRLESSDRDRCEFLENVWQGLKSAGFGFDEDDLKAGIYPAVKAECRLEGDRIHEVPQKEVVHRLAKGVYAIWPTLLTLAPVAANVLINNLEADGVRNGGVDPLAAWPQSLRERRRELWTTVQRHPLKDLRSALGCDRIAS